MERDAVRADWDERVAERGHFPAHRRSFLGERPKPVGLETFATWELPVPMSPQLFQTFYADSVTLPEAGLLVFIPSYALRDERLTLKDLAKQLAAAGRREHLEGWMARGTEGRTKLGYQRLYHTLVLYRYWTLGLASRGPERLEGSTERLDRVFASFLRLGDESIKKVRLALRRPPLFPGEDASPAGNGGGET